MKELRFALGYMPHRLWGHILQAQFLEKEPGKEFFTPREYIQNDPSTQAYGRLTPMQREAVGLMDEYSDRKLHKLFSKKRTVKEFMDTVDRERIGDHIRPYIEKYLYRILTIARDNRFELFVKDKGDRSIFPEDFIRIEKNAADPVFIFNYRDRLSYSLNLIHGTNRLLLHMGHVEVVSKQPAAIILGSSLYFINDIDGKKLKPFLNKESVVIPKEVEKKYFSTFVRNTLRDFNAVAEGFPVTEVDVKGKAEVIFELGLNRQPCWILSFSYRGHRIYPDSRLKRFVEYTGDAQHHSFERYERDLKWEERMRITLNESGLRTRDQKNYYLKKTITDGGMDDLYAAVNFMNENGSYITGAGICIRQKLPKSYFLGRIDLKMESSEQQDWFDVHATAVFGECSIPFLNLRRHILEGIREYELPDGQVAVIPGEWFARYKSMFEFGKSGDDRIRIHKQHFSQVEGPMKAIHADTLSRLERLNAIDKLPSLAVPGELRAELRKYQIEGYQWLYFLRQNGFGGCLADDMGLGKTLQALAILLKSKEDGSGTATVHAGSSSQLSMFGSGGPSATSLIVVPASLLHNWLSECRRFAPGLKAYPYVGNMRNRDLTRFGDYDAILSTYHTVRQDIDALSSYSFHYVILDESQMIKNPSSKLYQSMIELQAEHRIVLTGTPVENSLTDLWSQINFVNPDLLGSLGFFKRSFVVPIEKKKDREREEKLKELINPFILRRTKQEVARELPEVHEQIRYCNMAEDQRRLYEEEKSLARNAILENLEEIGLEKTSFMVLQALTRLRQIANHPALVEELNGTESGKFNEVYRNVESVLSEGHKVLMFSSFVKHLELFRRKIEADRMPYAWLTGSHSHKQREQAVREFQGNDRCRLFLISLKAGGVGLNLTAADYVFILDPWWNPAAELQALNRAHRIGQENNVFVYRFISIGTIEEKIRRLQERKLELAETFVTSGNPLKDLSEKELMELFS